MNRTNKSKSEVKTVFNDQNAKPARVMLISERSEPANKTPAAQNWRPISQKKRKDFVASVLREDIIGWAGWALLLDTKFTSSISKEACSI